MFVELLKKYAAYRAFALFQLLLLTFRYKVFSPAAETAAESVETAVDAVETEVANEVSEEVPLREVPEPEAIETKPLNLRQDRYLDETPQEPDWAD